MKKTVTVQDLGLKFDTMPEAQRGFMMKCAEMICDIINKSNEGVIDETEFVDRMKTALKPFEGITNESVQQLVKDHQDALDTIKSLGEEIEKLKQRGISTDFVSKFDESFNEMYDSESFQKFAFQHGASAKGFVIKDISLTQNYTGDSHVMLTGQSNDVVTQARDKQSHIRDYAVVLEGDPEQTSIAYQEIYEVDRNARYVSENGMLPESMVKMREKSAEVKRAGTHFRISKRMLKSRVYIRSFILNMAVEAVRNNEDFGILFGDGSGDNLKGITSYEGVIPVETILTDNIVSIPAGGIESIEEVGNGILIHLAKPYDLLRDGFKIVVSGATTSTGLNGTFDVIRQNDTTLLLYGAKLKADATDAQKAADLAALTAVVRNGLYQSIESPNSMDALQAAVAVMTYAQFRPTILALNPLTITAISCEKATDGNRLEVVRDVNGNLKVGSLTVVPNTDIPMGHYFLGDLRNGAKIVDYTAMTLEWADDVNCKLKNQVVLICQEELILLVECPYAFSYGKLADLKTALKKSAS